METDVGWRVRRWRLYRGMTLKQCATASGLHVSSLCRIEQDKQSLRHEDAVNLCAAFRVTVARFYLEPPPHGVIDPLAEYPLDDGAKIGGERDGTADDRSAAG